MFFRCFLNGITAVGKESVDVRIGMWEKEGEKTGNKENQKKHKKK